MTSARLRSRNLALGKGADEEVEGSKELFADCTTLQHKGGTSARVISRELHTQELGLINTVFVLCPGLNPEP